MTASLRDRHLLCPRCRYDMRGESGQWRDFCPIRGRCNECGYGFFWADLYGFGKGHPRWCVEADGGQLWFPVRAVRSVWRTVLTHRMWYELHMALPVRIGRVMTWIIALMIIVMLLPPARRATEYYVAKAYHGPPWTRVTDADVRDWIWKGHGIVVNGLAPGNRPAGYRFNARERTTTWHYPLHFEPRWEGWIEAYPFAIHAASTLLFLGIIRCSPTIRIARRNLLRPALYGFAALVAFSLVRQGLRAFDSLGHQMWGASPYLYRSTRPTGLIEFGHKWASRPMARPVSFHPTLVAVLMSSVLALWYWYFWFHTLRDYVRTPRPASLAAVLVVVGTIFVGIMPPLFDWIMIR